jgi:hypothetical protein
MVKKKDGDENEGGGDASDIADDVDKIVAQVEFERPAYEADTLRLLS